MELLVGQPQTLYVEGYGATSVSLVSWKLNGVEQPALASASPVSGSNGLWKADIPFLTEEGEVEAEWLLTFSTGSHTVTKFYESVTPLLSVREVQAIWEDATEQQARDVEAAARYVISAHTGQTFGRHTGAKTVRGKGEPFLKLPARLLEFTEVTGWPYLQSVSIQGDGWYLVPAGASFYTPPVREDFEGVNSGSHQAGFPIRLPNWVRGGSYSFGAGTDYTITGTWGWKYVPAPVKEAAKLLVNDIASGDNIYRDRYLTSMTAADWRIQYNSGAFANTGNARADELLRDYVLNNGWAVL